MYLSMGQLPKVVGAGPMTVFNPGSVGTGARKLVPGKRPKTGGLEAQILRTAQIANQGKKKLKAAAKDASAQKKVIQNAIALTRSTTGKFKKDVAMGFWPVDQIADATVAGYKKIAEKATELVTGVSAEQMEATRKVAEAQEKMVADRVASGAMSPEKGKQLTSITKGAAKDAEEAVKASTVLNDAAKTATNGALKALGLPDIGATWKYVKWGTIVAGLLVGAWVVYPYLKAVRLPGEAARKAAGAKLARNRW